MRTPSYHNWLRCYPIKRQIWQNLCLLPSVRTSPVYAFHFPAHRIDNFRYYIVQGKVASPTTSYELSYSGYLSQGKFSTKAGSYVALGIKRFKLTNHVSLSHGSSGCCCVYMPSYLLLYLCH